MHMERLRLRTWIVVMACVTGLGAARSTVRAETTVVDDVTLPQDLVCIGNGLSVGASGIRIDLNGFTIQGSGGGTAVAVVSHTEVTISGGSIRQFAVGIRVNYATNLEI